MPATKSNKHNLQIDTEPSREHDAPPNPSENKNSPQFYKPRTSYINLDEMFDALLPPIPSKVGQIVEKISPQIAKTLHQLSERSAEEEGEKPTAHVSYDGFLNLALIVLVAACVLLAADNYVEKGILVDLTLLRCMSGDFGKALLITMIVAIGCGAVYLTSCINMYLVFRTTGSAAPFWKVISVILYICTQLGMVALCGQILFKQHVSIVVSSATTIIILVYGMKMHSLFIYVLKNFVPLSKEKKADDSMDDKIARVYFNEFLYFLVAPTMCFVRGYPRSKNIRIFFCLRMLMGMLISGTMSYILILQYIDPVLKKSVKQEQTTLQVVYDMMKLSIPWFICWLLGSFALFHCYLNLIAELTRFADRLWYRDFWNAEDFATFWRRWNIPTHHWLLKYVYLQYMQMHYHKPIAVFSTFLLSAILHELAMSIMFHSFKWYFFMGMIAQAPFVFFSGKVSGRTANFLIWFSLFCGQPLMLLLYFRDWYRAEGSLCTMQH